jgi:hypothetical protein
MVLTACLRTAAQSKPSTGAPANSADPVRSRLGPSDKNSTSDPLAIAQPSTVVRFRHDVSPLGPLGHSTIPVSAWHSENESTSPIGSRRQLQLGKPNYRPWARLLNEIHVRVHHHFANEYLSSLDKLPPASPFQDPTLRVQIELQVVQRTGEIETIGVRRTSGIAEFDIAAMIAMSDAFPLQIPPGLASPDGRVYLVWELTRGPTACSTLFAHPFRLQ